MFSCLTWLNVVEPRVRVGLLNWGFEITWMRKMSASRGRQSLRKARKMRFSPFWLKTNIPLSMVHALLTLLRRLFSREEIGSTLLLTECVSKWFLAAATSYLVPFYRNISPTVADLPCILTTPRVISPNCHSIQSSLGGITQLSISTDALTHWFLAPFRCGHLRGNH
jgi:hypothetical protein